MSTTTKDKTSNMTVLTLTIPVELNNYLQELASMANSDLEGLAVGFLEEGVHKAMPKLKKEHYFKHLREVLKKHNVPAETLDTLEDNFVY